MSIRRSAQILVSLVVAAVLATPSAAGARSHTTYIVRDGFWGGISGSNLASFDVRHRSVSHLRFVLSITCHNTEFNTDSTDTFIGGRSFPSSRIPSGGRLTVNWSETDAGRHGRINAELDWSHRRPMASISLTGAGDSTHPEDCIGFGAVNLTRGPLHHHA